MFGRSVTFRLQSQFAHEPGFDTWYSQQQSLLRGQRLSRFLLEQRNYVLKVRPAVVHRIVGVAITEAVFARDEISVQVIRGQPWWRRSPRVLVEDALYPWRQRFRLWRERRQWRHAAKKSAQSTSITTSDELHFGEAEWKDTPALELVEQHLDTLAKIVGDAEARFQGAAGKGS